MYYVILNAPVCNFAFSQHYQKRNCNAVVLPYIIFKWLQKLYLKTEEHYQKHYPKQKKF